MRGIIKRHKAVQGQRVDASGQRIQSPSGAEALWE